ncbi:hypothetical protein QBC38DRAFT_485617 [Podospora fimiseda]|uniref:D-xylose 1-dehydrogenase (NADP(+), D-xylono-1,5-lactone-forming) n=1 Tax=Podospora fimiseda TaxID=252190 RepID=A0AAN7BJI4_9PEZI|nr:hypothetical protein QBC38DRAFT_485617 [Podospora fimiseda]
MVFALLSRVYSAFGPPKVEKQKDGIIRFGILGAAQIAPLAIITPAINHPEVIIQAVAARDRKRAEEFAKKHGIPDVHDSYQAILDDPNIDAIFIPLPNSLHFEWAVRSIRAGKHVLLEKPSVNTAAEAEILFNLPELKGPNPPVLLEAFHNRFHPALQKFLSFIDHENVAHVHTDSMVPAWMTDKDNIGYNYKMGGGGMMMMGTYNFGMLRLIFGTEPQECTSCTVNTFEDGVHDQCDIDFKAQFRFPGGAIGEAETTMRGGLLWKPSEARVTHREVIVPDSALPASQEKARTRTATLHGFIHAVMWHRIDVRDEYVIRNKKDGSVVRKWTENNSYKAYSFKEAVESGGENAEQFKGFPGEVWWMSYRYQLEAFVNKVKGRPTQFWVSGEDSLNQMKMLDMAYLKSGLGLRPTSSFR